MEAVAFWIEDREPIGQKLICIPTQSSFENQTKTTTKEVLK